LGNKTFSCPTQPFWLSGHASSSDRDRGYFNGERDSRALKLMLHLHIVLSQKMRSGKHPLHSGQKFYLLYFRTEKLWLSPNPVTNSGKLSDI